MNAKKITAYVIGTNPKQATHRDIKRTTLYDEMMEWASNHRLYSHMTAEERDQHGLQIIDVYIQSDASAAIFDTREEAINCIAAHRNIPRSVGVPV